MQQDFDFPRIAKNMIRGDHGYELEDNEIIVDLFAGGGGVSTGIEMALGRSPDVAVNHDPDAIAMHEANHPLTTHYQTSVYAVNPDDAVPAGKEVGLLWASPDCRSHSRAKGGAPKSKGVRDLAWIVVHWIERKRPRVICVENVNEMIKWCELDDAGHPIKAQEGKTFLEWWEAIRKHGYKIEKRELNAADYGAPTTRKRLFIVARRDGLPIRWPDRTHAPHDHPDVLSGKLSPWRTAAEIIDFTIPTHSIFLTKDEAKIAGCKRPLADKTMRRIARGMYRHVIHASDPFMVAYYGEKEGESFRGSTLDRPFHTQTTANRFGLVVPLTHQGDDRVYGMQDPLRTITAANRAEMAIVSPTIIQTGYGERKGQAPRVPGIGKPIGTIVAGGQKHALAAAHLSCFNQNAAGSTPGDPLKTVMAGATRHVYIESAIVGGIDRSLEVAEFLWKYRELSEKPVTRDSMGIVHVDGNPMKITDIGLRMITPNELYDATGFPSDYQNEIVGGDFPRTLSKSARVRLVGNAVPPPMVAHLIAANVSPTKRLGIAA